MSNTCSSIVVFKGKDLSEITKFYLKIHEAVREGGGVAWDILRHLGYTDGEIAVDGRTDVDAIEYTRAFDPEEPDAKEETIFGVRLDVESAWEPPVDFFKMLLAKILPSNRHTDFVFLAEEPGNEIYINTDEKGIFLKDAFVIDYDDGECSDREYFSHDDLTPGFDLIKTLTGVTVTNLGDLKSSDFCRMLSDTFKAKHPDVEVYLTIGVFDADYR